MTSCRTPALLFLFFFSITAAACRMNGGGAVSAGEVTMATNHERVCYDDRRLPYLNFDLIVRNGTNRELQVREFRAVVTDGRGEVTERRTAAQQALELSGAVARSGWPALPRKPQVEPDRRPSIGGSSKPVIDEA
jgi:hypothetical protein